MEAEKHFVHQWGFNYEHYVELLTENWGLFVSGLFKEVFNLLSVQNFYTTTYHSKIMGRWNSTDAQ